MKREATYYLIGICGIGMSALAQLLHSLGFEVRGSDFNPDPEIFNILNSQGIYVYKGHEKGRLNNSDIVIYSTAVGEDNVEYQEARAKGLTLIHRMDAVKDFLKDKKVYSVTGTHGKTTTAYILSSALRDMGYKTGMLLGGIAQESKNNFISSDSTYILELDESDGSFLEMTPEIKIVTSLDLDHLEFYQGKFSLLKSKFHNFLEKEGVNIICGDDYNLREIVTQKKIKYIPYGFQKGAMYRGEIIETGEFGTRYRLLKKGLFITEVELSLWGYKTALNSLSLFALGDILRLDLVKLAQGLRRLQGVKRRYEKKFYSPQIKIIEDYAHHPSEIEEVIRTIRGYVNPLRIIVVYQPHRYTRTKYLWDKFRGCFQEADILLLTDIYPAFEEEIPGIDSLRLAQEVENVETMYVPLDKISKELLKIVKEGDTILILGAGNINKICPDLIRDIKRWLNI